MVGFGKVVEFVEHLTAQILSLFFGYDIDIILSTYMSAKASPRVDFEIDPQ
jgi:hypothetical protein